MAVCIWLDNLSNWTNNDYNKKRINMSEDVSSKVKKIVADHLGIDESKVCLLYTSDAADE